MKMKGNFTIVFADKYKMDNGSSGGKVYMMSDETTNEPNKCGKEVNSIKVDYDEFEMIVRPHHHLFPAKFECEFSMVAGAKKSTTMQLHSMKPLKGSSPASS